MAIAGHALKANITALGPLVLPVSEKLKFAFNLAARKLLKSRKMAPYTPDFGAAFSHFCIHTGGRGVIDELEKALGLTEALAKPSKDTLFRFGNTSAASTWCGGGGRGGGVGGVAGGLNRRPPSPFPRPPLQDPLRSRLRRLIPGVGAFFTPLDLTAALSEYDAFFALSRRRHVPPNFAELRHVLNLAQTHASAPGLKLVTFDADGTLYADGAHMRHDAEMVGEGRGGRGGIGWGRIWGRPHAPTPLFLPHQVDLMIDLLEAGIDVAIVTAAGYPGDAARFEHRVQGLLAAFAARDLPASVIDR